MTAGRGAVGEREQRDRQQQAQRGDGADEHPARAVRREDRTEGHEIKVLAASAAFHYNPRAAGW
jgi:hypothetical protein